MAEPPFGHESPGVSVRTILMVAAAFAVTTVAIVVLLRVVVSRYVIPQHAQLVARRATVPPAPRLQASPTEDVAALRAEKQALLSRWGWTDPTHKFARIPIERAMELTSKGLRAPADLTTRVGFDQELGRQAPMHARFVDGDGATVDLARLLDNRPTLIVPG